MKKLCFLSYNDISVQTSQVSSAQWPPVAGVATIWDIPGTFLLCLCLLTAKFPSKASPISLCVYEAIHLCINFALKYQCE